MTDVIAPPTADAPGTDAEGDLVLGSEAPAAPKRKVGLVRRVMMRPRRVIVKVHRWLSIALLAWVVIVSITGAWLVIHDAGESVLNPDRYHHTSGDVGGDAAAEAAAAEMPEGAKITGLTRPVNGRHVYQVYGEIEGPTPKGAPDDFVPTYTYLTAFVDPGTGEVNEVRNENEGMSWWMYRGHMYLWQDFGPFGMYDPDTGWCHSGPGGVEPGGVPGVLCDVVPDGMDLVGWFAGGFIIILLSGFYLWYWPGVRRWATAFVVRRGRGRFTFHMSVHKVVGFVVWAPLIVVAFTGAAFAFPNLNSWYENATPAARDFFLWEHPEELTSGEADGREPIGFDRAIEIYQQRFPTRETNYVGAPYDETGMYEAWTTRGFDPWTREGGAGNTLTILDQYSGELLYDGSPEDGNVFDQAWDDWSFPLHTGDFLGTTSRVAWTALGLSPLVLLGTGLTMWFVRRNKRKKRRPTAEAGSETTDDSSDDDVDPDAADVDPVEVPAT